MTADPKPPRRVQDLALLKNLHQRWRMCALCGNTANANGYLSLHHIHKHPRDDVEGNLVMLCGHGTIGCHGLIEAGDETIRKRLGAYLVASRPDTLRYLDERLGAVAAREWFQQRLLTVL